MFHLNVLHDPRISGAISEVQTKLGSGQLKTTFLDIVNVILTNLPALLPLLGNSTALIQAIEALMKPAPTPTPPPATPTP